MYIINTGDDFFVFVYNPELLEFDFIYGDSVYFRYYRYYRRGFRFYWEAIKDRINGGFIYLLNRFGYKIYGDTYSNIVVVTRDSGSIKYILYIKILRSIVYGLLKIRNR